jgi:hypothetical protein
LTLAINWHFIQLKDKKIANKLWKYSKFPADLPKIPLSQSYKIVPEIEPYLYHYNPSIVFEAQDLFICWRVSNYKGSPNVNWAKEELPSEVKFDPNQFRNSIALGKIENFKISDFPPIKNQKLIGSIEEFYTIDQTEKSSRSNIMVSTLIDPKFLGNNSNFIIGNFEAWTESVNGKYSVVQSMGVLDLRDYDSKILIPYQQNSYEKNWCFIGSTDKSLQFLRSSSPQIVLTVSSTPPYSIENVLEMENNKPFVNGGSNFVLTDEAYFLRIARYRMSSKGKYKCHISTVIKHDLNLNEISRTRPFIFRNFGFEICNGFQLHNNEFIFSWGENDESMYLGSMDKLDFLEWIESMWE